MVETVFFVNSKVPEKRTLIFAFYSNCSYYSNCYLKKEEEESSTFLQINFTRKNKKGHGYEILGGLLGNDKK